MSKVGVYIKAASGVIATSVALLTALRENPQIGEGINSAIDKLKQATNSQNPKLRFDAKLAAIDAAADAVEQSFPEAREPAGWRRQAQALRVRGELAWHSNRGGARRKAMKALNAETSEVLAEVNARLIELQAAAKPELRAD
ncbi:MAG: hypothetical protein QM713_07780 [Arachnia sp.]